MSNPRLQVDIGVNLKEFNQGMKDLTNRLKSVGDRLTSVGATLSTRLTLPLVAAGGAAIKLASDFEESLNKVNVAFDTSAGEVRRFSETTLESFGIAQGTALDMAALFGDMATAMGLPTDSAAKMSTELVGLAGDLASFKNQRIDIVQTALAGIFTGETESLKRLGIVMTQANLQAFALSQGIQTNIQDMTQAEQVNLRFAYVLDKTTNAQGDFARTSGGAANQMRIFQESLKELGQQFGQVMLPQFTEAVKEANGLIKAFAGLSDNTKQLAINTGAFLAVLGPITIFIGALATNIARLMTIAPKFAKWLFGVSGGATAAGAALIGLSADALSAARDLESFRNTTQKTLETMGEGMSIEEVNALIAEQAQKIEDLKNNFRGTTAAAVEAHQGQIRVAEETLNAFIKIRDDKAFDELASKINNAKTETISLNNELAKVKPTIANIAPKDNLILDGLGIDDNLNLTLEQLVNKWSDLSFLTGELPVKITDAMKVADAFTDSFARGLAQVIAYGESLGDMLKDLARQILREGIYRILMALFTGGTSAAVGAAGSFGSGLLSGIGNVFGSLGAPLSMGALPPMMGKTEVTGKFEIRGSDLVTVLSNANTRTLR